MVFPLYTIDTTQDDVVALHMVRGRGRSDRHIRPQFVDERLGGLRRLDGVEVEHYHWLEVIVKIPIGTIVQNKARKTIKACFSAEANARIYGVVENGERVVAVV